MKTFFVETINNKTFILSDFMFESTLEVKKSLGMNIDIQIDEIFSINAGLIGYEYTHEFGISTYPLIINNKSIVTIGNIEFRKDILEAYKNFKEDEELLTTIGSIE